MKLPIRDIRLDCGTQSRASLNQDTINQYAEDMTEGAVFPPPVVFYDGEKYILSVGFHRVHAALQAGFQDMECEVRNGTLRDAILFSIKSNADHGLPRTNADKKHAVKMAFQQLMEDGRNIRDVDDVSHTEVAKMAAVHHTFIMKIRVDIADELLGKCDYHTPPTIPPKSKQTSGEDTQRLKDELARAKEKISLLENLKQGHREHDDEMHDEIEGLLRKLAEAEQRKPGQIVVEKPFIPPDIQKRLREQEEQLKHLNALHGEEQKAAHLRAEIEALKKERSKAKVEASFDGVITLIMTHKTLAKNLVELAKNGDLTIQQIDEAENMMDSVMCAANDVKNAIRDIRGNFKKGGALRVL